MITPKQTQIIRLLMTNKEGFNVNQVSRILNISLSWTHEALKQLESQEILKSEKKANAVVFTLNWKNPKTEKICGLIILDTEENKNIEKSPASAETKQELKYIAQRTQQPQYQTSIAYSPSTYSLNNAAHPGFSYLGANPVGESGVNNVLFAYAQSGAFGSSVAYNSQPINQPTLVPPETLGARISRNVSGFNFASHSVEHRNKVATGCRYCDSI